MQKNMKELIEVLDLLIHHHKELLGVEQKKLTAIIDQNWEELELLLLKSKKILTDIEATEKQRMSIIQGICGKEDATLSEVGGKAPSDIAPQLKNCGKKMVDLLKRQKNMNENIERLLKSSLEIVNFSLSLFAGSEIQGRTYSGKGQEKGSEDKCTSLMFDIKA